MSTTTNYHHLTVTISPLGDVHWSIDCNAPQGTACRVWCDEGCEHPFDRGHQSHTMKDQGGCLITPFFEDGSMIPATFTGPEEQPLRSGPVNLFISDGEESWEYAEEEENDR
ncbi:hypothetical protein [Brachybacterium kimchii]|uniref:Uncharacterized protein n=1 Tax=Brachybacterium kimchii TaxID=2942909 RepID=A0ABY4NCB8_9MICO|nr:hypothetical protein [Brachybacterium kimchii]UQN31816.1 hypothetical protein M4486_19695 [Brachybacterium kimchii]